jgi:hypothetical protein
MSFSFHDLKHIVEAYLDDLASRSRKRTDHPTHLRLIFEHCRYFRIRLNPNKCSFCITSGSLLGFIISTTGIMVDPLKVEVLGPHIAPFCPHFLPLLYPSSLVFRLIISLHQIIPRYTTSFLITICLICFA